MKHSHMIIPVADASANVTDWWRETIDDESGDIVHALYDTCDSTESRPVASGANGYRHVEYDVVLHLFIGLTVEDRDDIRFIDLNEFIALGERHGFDAPEIIGEWQKDMDARANE